MTQLYSGEEAYIIGFNCGWYKVKFDGETGYIRSDLLDLTEIPYENSGSSNSPKYFVGGDPISSGSGSSSGSGFLFWRFVRFFFRRFCGSFLQRGAGDCG